MIVDMFQGHIFTYFYFYFTNQTANEFIFTIPLCCASVHFQFLNAHFSICTWIL